MSDIKDSDVAICEALYSHLVLPPQLPHQQDGDLAQLETALLDRLITSAQKVRDVSSQNDFQKV
jgi:hypothetical protein